MFIHLLNTFVFFHWNGLKALNGVVVIVLAQDVIKRSMHLTTTRNDIYLILVKLKINSIINEKYFLFYQLMMVPIKLKSNKIT